MYKLHKQMRRSRKVRPWEMLAVEPKMYLSRPPTALDYGVGQGVQGMLSYRCSRRQLVLTLLHFMCIDI